MDARRLVGRPLLRRLRDRDVVRRRRRGRPALALTGALGAAGIATTVGSFVLMIATFVASFVYLLPHLTDSFL